MSSSGSYAPGNRESNGRGSRESCEDGDCDRSGRSDLESNEWNRGGSDPESNRDGKEENDPDRSGLSCRESSGRSDGPNDAESSLENNGGSHRGDDGGEFREA